MLAYLFVEVVGVSESCKSGDGFEWEGRLFDKLLGEVESLLHVKLGHRHPKFLLEAAV